MEISVTNDELSTLLRSQENDVLDFKSANWLREPNAENRYKIAKHLVGFANHRGGKLVFGINDDRDPEGKIILEEESLRTISDVISSQISPSIDFSYSYFSAADGDLSEGSVFVVELQRSSSPIPHAIIEKSGEMIRDEIRKREYRIRAGESTRLVSNDELRAMFEGRTRADLKTSEILHFLLEYDYSPAKTKFKPQYQYTFDRHFVELRSDDETLIEKIRGGYPDRSDPGMKRIVDAQYALTVSTILSHPEFMMVSKPGLLERTDSQVDSLTFDIKSIEPSDIILRGSSNPLIDETNMGKPGILPIYEPSHGHFQIPASANVYVWEDFNGFDITNDHFSLSFSVDLIEVGIGLPTPHPDSFAEPGEYGLRPEKRSKYTMDAQISVNSEFKYPNQEFSEFESYRAYCEAIIEIFETVFDRENYLAQLPDNKLVKIEENIEEILSELKRMQEN